MNDLPRTVATIAVGLVFVGVGAFLLRRLSSVASFFKGRGASLYGEKVANKVYTEANLRWAAIPLLIFGPIAVVSGVVRLAIIISGHSS